MMRAKGKVSIPKLDLRGYRRGINKILADELKAATREWLKEVLLHVPVYTGTAKGTFKPLGRAVGLSVTKGPVTHAKYPDLARKKKQTTIGGRTFKLGFGAGAEYSEYRLFQASSQSPIEFTFFFDNKLPYFIWNDIMPAPQWLVLPSNPPWHAIEAGNKAFDTYVRTETIKKLPPLSLSAQIVRIT